MDTPTNPIDAYIPANPKLGGLVYEAMQEILCDIHAGRIPSTVRRFSELHAYVDANAYLWTPDEDPDPIASANLIAEALDTWLQAGGASPAIPPFVGENGVLITDPYMDESGRYTVDPATYYGRRA